MSNHHLCWFMFILITICAWYTLASTPTEAPSGIPASREVKIKQGKLKGLVLKSKRGNVEIFLGIPYASPPVGSQRFMPPGSPPPWAGVRLADSFGPVCPQTPPDISNERDALKAMSAGRYQYLKRLLPYLRNQSEDCLYLNIYAPSPGPSGSQRQPKYPVMVFIHGESYEWNAGNPYDGSVLASYGGVVVVTLNFRLGILGFLRPGIGGNTVSNFGLLDQVAALQWVKENIALFGGDPSSVTLLGHGTGAACANLLLVSPVSQAANGLFRRAILMSGTALADWALTKNPLKYTIQVAQALNCPVVERDDELAACLRRKRLSELLAVRVQAPLFDTPFGPVVDGSVVPNEPRLLMGVYKDLFSRYDLMYGVTEVESYHILDAVSLAYGMLEKERDELLRAYVTSRYELRTDAVFAVILQRYGPDWQGMPGPGGEIGSAVTAEQHRDVLLDILSDARVSAPLVQMADFHAPANPKSYLYVFTHRSKHGDFPGIPASVHGEELPYVFGVPLDGGRFHFNHKFAPQEALLSETVMTLWTNFAKTGNPNAPRKTNYSVAGSREWRQQELDWPEYDLNNQTFLRIGIPPDIRRHYRRRWMDFWNRDLPELLEDPTNTKMTSVKPRPVYQAPPPPPLPPPLTGWTQDPDYPDFRNRPPYPHFPYPENDNGENPDKSGLMDPPIDEISKGPPQREVIGDASSMALSIVVIIGVCFLLINCLAFSAIYYQRNRLRVQERRILSSQGIKPVNELSNEPGTCRALVQARTAGGTTEEEDPQQRRRWLIRQCSGSTVDPQTKVRDWIAHEIVQRCSPRFLRRNTRVPGSTATSTDKLSSTATWNRPTKVSVAVDATPHSRLDTGVDEQKSNDTITLQRSSTSINLTPLTLSNETPSSFNTECTSSTTSSFHNQQQHYPNADEICYYDQPIMPSQDINVTSRDDTVTAGLSTGTILATDAIDTMKRRNYPKVLPDDPVPEHNLIKRRSLPHPGYLQLLQPPNLPASAPTTPTKDGQVKVPPPPPPRTSTLKRDHSNVVTQPRVVIKPSAVCRQPVNRGGPRVNPTLSPSSPEDSSDSSTGTIKRSTKPSISTNQPKCWYAQYNKSVSSSSDTKGTE